MGGKGQHLAEFELYVMLAVAHLGDEAYGLSIRSEIEGRAERTVAIGAVYATLARLEEKGLVDFRIVAARPVRGGRARKHVRLTKAGERALRRSATMFDRMLRGMAGRFVVGHG